MFLVSKLSVWALNKKFQNRVGTGPEQQHSFGTGSSFGTGEQVLELEPVIL